MALTVTETSLPGVLVLEPSLHGDARGHFMETFNARDFARATGLERTFVQDNQSRSAGGVIRGMHYQLARPQGKLVRVLRGAIFDVAVDARRDSPHCGEWVGVELTEENRRQLWVPEGFAHGFVVLGALADVAYKATEFWSQEHDRSFRWDDPTVGVAWPLTHAPLVSAKDAGAPLFADADLF